MNYDIKKDNFKTSNILSKGVRSSHISVEAAVMGVERRGRQNMNLDTGTRTSHSRRLEEDEVMEQGEQLSFMPDRWSRIGFRAKDTSSLFNNIHFHINEDSLNEAFNALDGTKALGVDGVSKSEYGKNLQANLKELTKRVQNGSFRPRPKKEVLIPKANGKTRPIAISCFEDKLVDWVVSKVLTTIYEPCFIRNSFGYRPNKSTDGAIKACYYSLCKNQRKHALEIDFSSFFNMIPHGKLMKVLSKKITDTRFKRLIGRFLTGGIQIDEGESLPSEIGTPQGSIMSPILANIYLNEVIDQWFLENYGNYNNIIVRYADDAVFFFKDEDDCHSFREALYKRVQTYGLELNKEKTKVLDLSKGGNEVLTFLGLTIYWGKQGSRKILKVKTSKEKLIKSIQEFEVWIKKVRNQKKLKDIWRLVQMKLKGHINYFGYQGNQLKLNHFQFAIQKLLFKWLNRRSQRRSYNREGFKERLKNLPLMDDLKDLKLKQLGRNWYVH